MPNLDLTYHLLYLPRRVEPDRLVSADPNVCPAFELTTSYTYDQVVGVDFRDAPGSSDLEVTVDGGPWQGWIWAISLDEHYFEAGH